jgi:hypothetical protein
LVDRAAGSGRFVIRANLLPRPKETFGAFGIDLDADYVRQGMLGLAIVVVVALIGIGIELLHLSRLRGEAQTLETAIAQSAADRGESKTLALEVARYQEFARQAQLSRRSGPAAAIAIARIGNDVPRHAWLDTLAHSDAGYDLSGGASTVETISTAITALGHALPGSGATLVSVENHPSDGIRFGAHVGSPPAMPGTPQPWNAAR